MEFKFNQIIFNSLSERMKLEEIPLSQDLKSKDSFNKEMSIRVKLYKGEVKGTFVQKLHNYTQVPEVRVQYSGRILHHE